VFGLLCAEIGEQFLGGAVDFVEDFAHHTVGVEHRLDLRDERPGCFGAVLDARLRAGIIELACGLLIAIGLFTRPAAFIASGTMAVAYFMAHAPQNFWPVNNMGDAAVLYCFVFLYFVFRGAGALSVDGDKRLVEVSETERL